MLIFDLICNLNHEFEGWFKDSQEFTDQQNSGLLTCPICNSGQVNKKLSVPKVGKKSNSNDAPTKNHGLSADSIHHDFKNFQSALKKVHEYVENNFENVGNKFSEQAISMHKGEKERANIVGTASSEQLQEMADEGVAALPLPAKPIDKNSLN